MRYISPPNPIQAAPSQAPMRLVSHSIREVPSVNSLEFDALQLRILEHLEKEGPTTAERLAARLEAPQGNVRFALERLQERKEPPVKRLAFGFWDTNDHTFIAA